MKTRCLKVILLFVLTISGSLYAQSVLKGRVVDNETKEPIPGVSIEIKGKSEGGYTDGDGKFAIKVDAVPATLVFSFIGFETQEVAFNSASEVSIEMKSAPTFLNEVVVAASRSEQKKIESPVTIERIGSKEILNSPQVNYYNMIQGLRGVDVTVSSICLLYTSPSPRDGLLSRMPSSA